ncbi:hypothetical protein [Pseudomonas sp. NBRC 111129]|uniref:hypothetical protein n=1 Tax=Pseudomonas sp. NBRC 111129 TaxID=1661044 RepID=UPI0015A739A4|nr:hypothetical protein [Pseudomonas sp. NBRC 111129]
MSIRMSLGDGRISIDLAREGKTAPDHEGEQPQAVEQRKARGKCAAGCKNVRSGVSVRKQMSVFREAQVISLSFGAESLAGRKKARHEGGQATFEGRACRLGWWH